MTVCAAALCTAQFTKEGPPERIVLGICDFMLTSGEIEFEPGISKAYPLPLKRLGESRQHTATIVCLAADDSDLGYDLSVQTYKEAKESDKELSVREAASLYARKFTALRRERAERKYLTPFDLDSASFISQQQGMATEFVLDRASRLEDEKLEVETLVVGVDGDGPHIYHVFDPGQVVCRDRSGFWAIAGGKRPFENEFMSLRYDGRWPLLPTLLLMYSAKRKAERATGVGQRTDMFMITKDGLKAPTKANLDAIKEYCIRLEDDVEKCRTDTLKRMLQDPRLVAMPQDLLIQEVKPSE